MFKAKKDSDELIFRKFAAMGDIKNMKSFFMQIFEQTGTVNFEELVNSCNQEEGGSRRTAVHQAVIRDKPGALKLLISVGGDLHAKDSYGKTPLDYAFETNDDGSVKAVTAIVQQVLRIQRCLSEMKTFFKKPHSTLEGWNELDARRTRAFKYADDAVADIMDTLQSDPWKIHCPFQS